MATKGDATTTITSNQWSSRPDRSPPLSPFLSEEKSQGTSKLCELENTAWVSAQSSKGTDPYDVTIGFDITSHYHMNQGIDLQRELIKFLNAGIIAGDENEHRAGVIISKTFETGKGMKFVEASRDRNLVLRYQAKMMEEESIPWDPPWTMGNSSISIHLYTGFLQSHH
uniref:Uncharacterized protein n=1 Tax=Nelumbo nucifera TaxID=4432 RepID=A0A822XPU2_NELNU|nr:TPA_asm: hypothetical protein HUJ06_025087 [Nelumbo nucifera]